MGYGSEGAIMIHDATVEVTCDGDGCTESVLISPDFGYPNYSGEGGSYKTDDHSIESKLSAEDWCVCDGKHFCESCLEDLEEGVPQ